MIPLSDQEQLRFKEMEYDKSISVDSLMAWRNLADAQSDLERSKVDDLKPKRSSSGLGHHFFWKDFKQTCIAKCRRSADQTHCRRDKGVGSYKSWTDGWLWSIQWYLIVGCTPLTCQMLWPKLGKQKRKKSLLARLILIVTPLTISQWKQRQNHIT